MGIGLSGKTTMGITRRMMMITRTSTGRRLAKHADCHASTALLCGSHVRMMVRVRRSVKARAME